MTLFARIQDPTGPSDGLNGWVVSIHDASDRAALEAEVGAEFIGEFVEAPNGFCIGWRYEDGAFAASGEVLKASVP